MIKHWIVMLSLGIMLTPGLRAQDSKVLKAFEQSYEYEQYKQYEKAAEVLVNVYSSTSYEMNLRLGWLNYLVQDYTRSLNYYKKAITAQPKSIEARIGYIYPASASQNWDEVISKYKEILKIDPNHTKSNYWLGYIYWYRKDFNKAYDYIKRVVDLYPFDYDSVILLAACCTSMGKLSDARKYYTRVLMYNPNDQTALSGLAKLK